MPRKIVFVDYDGVLHGANTALFGNVPALETFFKQPTFVEFALVISSTWRLGRKLDGLREPFSADFRARIIDKTPALSGLREEECLAWLDSNHCADALWIALDDIERYFPHQRAHLYLCNPQTGFTQRDFIPLAGQIFALQDKI